MELINQAMKITILPNLLLMLIFVFAFDWLGFAQTTSTTTSINWVNYSVKSSKVTFLMPKLPIVIDETNKCRGEETFAFGSYAEGVGYVVRITKKIDVPEYCREQKEFDKQNFENRIQTLKNNTALALKEVPAKKSNETKLIGTNEIYQLANDSKNNRWFEMVVVGAVENNKEVKNFFLSLKTEKKTITGIEIGTGASRVLGDEIVKENTDKSTRSGGGGGGGNPNGILTPQVPIDKSTTSGVRIVLKPRAFYTDQARKNQTQGKVVLRVTFSANGGIGSISVVSGLSDGLTEQAILAAQLILFIPAQRNGVRYSVTKPVEYTFTIY